MCLFFTLKAFVLQINTAVSTICPELPIRFSQRALMRIVYMRTEYRSLTKKGSFKFQCELLLLYLSLFWTERTDADEDTPNNFKLEVALCSSTLVWQQLSESDFALGGKFKKKRKRCRKSRPCSPDHLTPVKCWEWFLHSWQIGRTISLEI